MYQNTQPLFDAPHGDLATFYMDVSASFDAMMELLNFSLMASTRKCRPL